MGSSAQTSVGDTAGLIPRAAEHIFAALQTFAGQAQLRASFVEIYNEEVRDLLLRDMTAPERQRGVSLRIIEDPATRSIQLLGVTEEPIESERDLLDCLQRGCASRQTASTLLNSHSSRSHAIFLLNLQQRSDEDFKSPRARGNGAGAPGCSNTPC